MVELEIDSKAYTGFTDINVTRSLDSITGSFSMSLTDRYRGDDLPPINAGQKCKIYKDGVLVKTGIIDMVSPSVNGTRVSLKVSGRDNPDVADCSIDHGTGEWKNIRFDTLVGALVEPFRVGINVLVDDTGDAIPTANYDPGTKVYELIRKYAEKKQLLVYSGLDGRLVIDQASKQTVDFSLVEGGNIIKASGNIDYSNVFSKYIVKGDRPSRTTDEEEEETQAQAIFEYPKIGRHRPLVIVSEGQVDNGSAKKYAQWVGTTRLAQSESFSVEIQGWHHEINKLITLDSPTLKLEKTQLLIAGVQLVEDEDGDRTVFHLVPKNAFDPTPVDVLLDDDKSTSYAGKHDNF